MKSPTPFLLALVFTPLAWAQTPAPVTAASTDSTHVCSTLAYLRADSQFVTLKAQPSGKAQDVARVLDGRQMFCVVYRPEGGRHWTYVVPLAPESDYHRSMWCTLNQIDTQHPLCAAPVLPVLLPAQPHEVACQIRESGDADNNLNLHMQGRCAQGWIPNKKLHIMAE